MVKWLKSKDAYCFCCQTQKPKKRSRVVFEEIDSQWYVDLMDVGSLAKKNDGVKLLFVAINFSQIPFNTLSDL